MHGSGFGIPQSAIHTPQFVKALLPVPDTTPPQPLLRNPTYSGDVNEGVSEHFLMIQEVRRQDNKIWPVAIR